MARILSQGNGYQILYKERGEDSEKIAPSGMSALSRLDVPVPGIIAVADSGKRIRILDKKYYLVYSIKVLCYFSFVHICHIFYLRFLIDLIQKHFVAY